MTVTRKTVQVILRRLMQRYKFTLLSHKDIYNSMPECDSTSCHNDCKIMVLYKTSHSPTTRTHKTFTIKYSSHLLQNA